MVNAYSVSSKALCIAGGAGKRPRGSAVDEDDAPRGRIQEFLGEIVAKPDDFAPIARAIADDVNILGWIDGMSVQELESVKEIMTKYEKNGHTDHVIKLFSKHYPAMKELQVGRLSWCLNHVLGASQTCLGYLSNVFEICLKRV